MAKTPHQEPQSSKTTMAVLIIGGILVAGLLVWALTRTVEPQSVMTTAPAGETTTTFTPPPATATGNATTATSPFAANDTSVTMPPPATPPAQPQGNRAEVKRISAEDLRSQVGRNEVTVIDVRAAADYARGHIPGSINIPFASVEAQLDSIPKGKPIVTYCT